MVCSTGHRLRCWQSRERRPGVQQTNGILYLLGKLGRELLGLGSRSRFAALSWLAALAIAAGRTRDAHVAPFADWPRFAALSWLAALAIAAGRTRDAHVAPFADWSRFAALSWLAALAISTVAHHGDLALGLAAQFGDTGTQFSNCRLRLRLDKHALALPLFALLRECMTERVSPSLKQSISLWCGRRFQ
jgi:hypothetical protein